MVEKTTHFFVKDESGTRHGFSFENDSPHLIRFTGGGQQSVPPMWDTDCYQFSHGGALYQKACRRVWEWQEAQA